jgi:hypothetical protein
MLKPTGGWGYHSDTEILFPMRVAPGLQGLRGDIWRGVVDQACRAEEGSLDQLAFSLLMIRLDGCLTCHTDCYRAMRGCNLCATLAVRRFRGSDEELAELYQTARGEVADFLENGRVQTEGVAD